MRRYGVIFCTVAAALASACASDNVPAEQAVKAAEAAVAAIGPEAARLVPDQAKALDAAVASVKDKFAKGEYEAVLTEALEVRRFLLPVALLRVEGPEYALGV